MISPMTLDSQVTIGTPTKVLELYLTVKIIYKVNNAMNNLKGALQNKKQSPIEPSIPPSLSWEV